MRISPAVIAATAGATTATLATAHILGVGLRRGIISLAPAATDAPLGGPRNVVRMAAPMASSAPRPA